MLGSLVPEVLRQFFNKPATNLYPAEKFPVPADFRGKLVADIKKCIGCKMCSRDCPADAIKVIKQDTPEKKFTLHIYLDRCICCGQCVDVCPTKTLSMLSDHEYAAYSRKEHFTEWKQ
ncbi:MAG: 4Fe-4S dicluster domain-containing protein [Candidatus Margulisiibacteriota bacterium]